LQNGLNDLDSRKKIPFAVKIATFYTRKLQMPKPPKLRPFSGFENYPAEIACSKIFTYKLSLVVIVVS